MTDLSDVRLPLAEQAFAVANTPLFLLRKLRSDPAVLEIARVAQPKAILSALKKSLRRKPKTLSDAVRPYVYLVALSMTRDLMRMEEAARLASRHSDWFSYIAKLVLDTLQPTSFNNMQIPRTLMSSSTTTSSSAPTRTEIVAVRS